MRVRPATGDDLEELAALAAETFVDAFGATMQASDLEAHLDRHLGRDQVARLMREDTFLVAEHRGRMVGFVQFGPSAGDTRDRVLHRLYVRGDMQGRGFGTALIEAALASPGMSRAPRMFLDVWEHNRGARRLYERYGFEVVDRFRMDLASGPAESFDLVMVRVQSAA